MLLREIIHPRDNYIYQDYIPIKNAPAENIGVSDVIKERLIENYDSMNQFGTDKLVEYSDSLADGRGNPIE